MRFNLPEFGSFLKALNDAGVKTASARGFWGGITEDDDIVVTAWIDSALENDRFVIWKPRTRHGGLLDRWELGRIVPNATVKLILLRAKPSKDDDAQRHLHSAGLMAGRWKIVEILAGGGKAVIEPA